MLSLSKGIVHPYYVSALAPGTGAMAGAGAVALVALARGAQPRSRLGIALAALAVGGTLAAQVMLMHREHYLLWFIPVADRRQRPLRSRAAPAPAARGTGDRGSPSRCC